MGRPSSRGLFDGRHDLLRFPDVAGNPCIFRWRHSSNLVDAAEVVTTSLRVDSRINVTGGERRSSSSLALPSGMPAGDRPRLVPKMATSATICAHLWIPSATASRMGGWHASAAAHASPTHGRTGPRSHRPSGIGRRACPPPMNPSREKALFVSAAEKPASGRPAFLDARCGAEAVPRHR